MQAERILKNVLALGVLLLFSLALFPCPAIAGKPAPRQSLSSPEGAPLLLAQSSKPDAPLVPPPEPSMPGSEAEPVEKKPSPLADMGQDDEGGVSGDGGRVEAAKPKAGGKYGGPLGGLGISCEDQKDLQALALGTYGNLLKAVTNSPGIVNCAPKPDEKGGGPASPGKEGGKPEGGG